MSSVLITGGTGFIGSHTVVELIKAGHMPVIIDNFSNSSQGVLDRIEKIAGLKPVFYEGDVRDKELLREIISTHKIEDVIHFAAFKAVGESVKEPLKYYDNNIGGLVSLLEALKDLPHVRFVFSSSATVYGVPDTLPLTEESPLKPAANPYGATKQMGEQIITDFQASQPGFSATLLRYFNPIGAHETGLIGELPTGVPNNLVPFVTQAAAGVRERLTIFGNDYDTPDGTAIRDYIHVVDLAEAHVKAIDYLQNQSHTSTPNIFNLGTGKGSSVLEAVNAFEKATGRKVPYIVGERRAGDPPAVYADVTKAEVELGWKATRDLETALADAWRWQQSL